VRNFPALAKWLSQPLGNLEIAGILERHKKPGPRQVGRRLARNRSWAICFPQTTCLLSFNEKDGKSG